jgi:hypothetical protein
MLAFSKYVDENKKKPKGEYGDANEYLPNPSDKFHISYKSPAILDDITEQKPFSIAGETKTDPYEENQPGDKFKSKPMNFQDFDELLIGFEYHPQKSDTILANNDTRAMFGIVSPSELALSNFETQAGTSNRINRLQRQKDYGESMELIRENDKNIDKENDLEFDEHYSNFMKMYKDEVAELPSNKKSEFREAVQGVKARDKIRKKGLKSKTIISPVSGETIPPVIEQIIESKEKKDAKKVEQKKDTSQPEKIKPVKPNAQEQQEPAQPKAEGKGKGRKEMIREGFIAPKPKAQQQQEPAEPKKAERKEGNEEIMEQEKPQKKTPKKSQWTRGQIQVEKIREPETEKIEEKPTLDNLEKQSIKQLKILAKAMEVKSYSKMNKAELKANIEAKIREKEQEELYKPVRIMRKRKVLTPKKQLRKFMADIL